MRRVLLLALLLPAVCAAGFAGEAVKLDVPLTIYDAGGVPRKGGICSTGVPLPCGLLQKPENIAVCAPGGRAVPAQFKVLERWREKAEGKDDLSIKWLLVTFPADVPKGGKALYHLRPGKNPAPAAPVAPVKKGAHYEMGGLTFKQDMSAPFKLVMTDPDGKEITASDLPVKWSVWEAGPVRACLKAESATVPGKFGFTAWIYAYAGQKRWDLTLTLNNTPAKVQGPLYFKDFSVIWEPPELKGAKSGLLGGEAGKAVKASTTAYLYQDSDGTEKWNTMEKWRSEFVLDWSKEKKLRMAGVPSFRGYKVVASGQETGKGNSALGWVALNGGGTGALVRLRHFRQNYPKAVEVEPGRLIVRLWPKYYKGYGGLQWLDDATRKDHDLSFTLKDGPVSNGEGEAAAKAFNARLVAHCGLAWYRLSGVYRPGPRRYPARHTGPDPRPWGHLANRNWVTFGGDVTDRIRRRYHGYGKGPFLSTPLAPLMDTSSNRGLEIAF